MDEWHSLIYFYSIPFLIFFIAVGSIYWILPSRWRNAWILTASYVFYGSWNIHFLPLLATSTLINYFSALQMTRRPRFRHLFFCICLSSDLGMLFFFKYFRYLDPAWEIILPLGISFYTFQTLSYSIDVFKNRIAPESNFIDFAVFVSFFPQLIAGPIERAADFIPQTKKGKSFWDVPWRQAVYLFIFGMFKKRVLGDYFALITHDAFDVKSSKGISVILGFFSYGLQAYCDISGYTDMARGLALSLGFQLNRNFNFPFFSRNPSEFWERWHISLTQWMKHYVYVPLLVKTRNGSIAIILSFLAVSLWYGPYPHFLLWGIYWSVVVMSYHLILKPLRFPVWVRGMFGYGGTFLAIFLGLSLFRTENVGDWYNFIQRGVMTRPQFNQLLDISYAKFYFCALALLSCDLYLYRKDDEFYIAKKGFYYLAVFYISLLFIYRNIGPTAALDFIYFKF